MTWVGAIIAWFMGMFSVATMLSTLGAMWASAKRDTAAGGLGMGRIRGHRQGLFYGDGGVIDSAFGVMASLVFLAIALAIWATDGVWTISVASSLGTGLALGISMWREEQHKFD